jgi:putative CocE/NonD family hydrolase
VTQPTSRIEGSAITSKVAVERNVRVPMRDGVTLAVDVYRPADVHGRPLEGRFPTVIERTPYQRTRAWMNRCGQYFASRGYVWLAQDVRGRYDSEGEFTLYEGFVEAEDGYDTLEWIVAQPWSDGKVGTTGLSQAGCNQQALAIMNPPGLTAQAVLDCGIDYWERPLRNVGAFADGIFAPYVFKMAITSREAAADKRIKKALESYYHSIDDWLPRLPLRRGSTPLSLVPGYEDWYFRLAATADRVGPFESPMASIAPHMDRYPDIPILLMSSWYGNRHAWGNMKKFDEMSTRFDSPVRLIIGPWLHVEDFSDVSHAGNIDLGDTARLGLNEVRLQWFDAYLKGMNTLAYDEERPVSYLSMGGGSGLKNWEGRLDHGGLWHHGTAFPQSPEPAGVLHLWPSGELHESAPEEERWVEYTFDPRNPVPSRGGAYSNNGGGWDQNGSGLPARGPAGAIDASLGVQGAGGAPLDSRSDVVAFRTPVLEDDLQVDGEVWVDLWVRSSAVDTDFTAKLIDEYPPNDDYPQGYAVNLCDEIVRMSYRHRDSGRDLIEPGEEYRISIGPMIISANFAQGHRLRVDISSSNFPQFDVNPNTGADFGTERGSVIARNAFLTSPDRSATVTLGGRR